MGGAKLFPANQAIIYECFHCAFQVNRLVLERRNSIAKALALTHRDIPYFSNSVWNSTLRFVKYYLGAVIYSDYISILKPRLMIILVAQLTYCSPVPPHALMNLCNGMLFYDTKPLPEPRVEYLTIGTNFGETWINTLIFFRENASEMPSVKIWPIRSVSTVLRRHQSCTNRVSDIPWLVYTLLSLG